MKLSHWAQQQGITYTTALKWFHDDNLPVKATQLPTSTILVDDSTSDTFSSTKTIIYTRVSSYQNKDNLTRQAQLCEEFCAHNGVQIDQVVKEVASGMNENRPKLNKILQQNNVNLVVLYKDRLTRFGFTFIKGWIEAKGGKIIVINAVDDNEEDLLKDFIAVITSFCCRLYGARRGQKTAKKMKDNLT
jgi:predicted site-specific integrase-resolvase